MSEIAARREAVDDALRGLVTGSYNGQSIPKQRTIDYAAEVGDALTHYRAIEDAAIRLPKPVSGYAHRYEKVPREVLEGVYAALKGAEHE